MYKNAFGMAGAATIGACYSLMALAVKFKPYETLKFVGTTGMIPHLENLSPYFKITTEGLLVGLAVHLVTGYFIFFMIAFFYNLFSPSE